MYIKQTMTQSANETSASAGELLWIFKIIKKTD